MEQFTAQYDLSVPRSICSPIAEETLQETTCVVWPYVTYYVYAYEFTDLQQRKAKANCSPHLGGSCAKIVPRKNTVKKAVRTSIFVRMCPTVYALGNLIRNALSPTSFFQNNGVRCESSAAPKEALSASGGAEAEEPPGGNGVAEFWEVYGCSAAEGSRWL